jgi:hypothetical protein
MGQVGDMISGVKRFLAEVWAKVFLTAFGAGLAWAVIEFPKLTLPALAAIAAAIYFLHPKAKTGRQLRKERRKAERESRSKQSASV